MKISIAVALNRLKTLLFLLCGLAVLLFACTNAYPIGIGSYSTPEHVLRDICKNSVAPLIACCIYISIAHAEDFNSGVVRHLIANGVPRSAILFGKYLHSLLACLLLYLADILLSVSALNLAQGAGITNGWPLAFRTFLCSAPFLAALVAMVQFISVVSVYSGLCMAVSAASVFVLTGITNILTRVEPHTILAYLPLGGMMQAANYVAALPRRTGSPSCYRLPSAYFFICCPISFSR
ncbi:MAG: hypothetical protein PHO10_10320 [Gemmiger sp.]|nr:hypothetical protein [Gemmiger sp.]